uniref:Centrosomal protein 120kDa n=1 Tax=Iconisemion striatum TaxID=60296 RepID=A0A1A7YZX1_9TELE
MSGKPDQLLVVSILEGRNFPKSPRRSVVVQASFNGEQLATDPVVHREQPQFCTELAWELDRKMLHHHRLWRTPIKLECFVIDPISNKREGVGYIILDFRAVQEVRQEPRWYPLLSSKYTKQKPALLIGVMLENDSKASEASPERFKARKAPPRQGSASVTDLLPDKLEAVLIPDQGYHQVGPADLCSDMFVLSVTVAFATRLEQLIPSTKKLSSEESGCFFYYSLLGNDITSEPFHNLLGPDFEPERASVRIRSSKRVLQTFLSQQPSLQSEAESLLEELELHKEPTGAAAADVEVPAPPPHQSEVIAAGGAASISVSAPKVAIPSSAHHYCFSLDLRSLGKLSLPHSIAATLRYSYRFFGSAAPIMTNPPVELQRNMEVSLPQSYCAFDFAALPHQLQDTFLRVPLMVELWHKGSTSRDQLIGRASVHLSHLLNSDRTRTVRSTGEQSWKQTHQDRIPVVQPQSPAERVAELSYMATLEDLGFVRAKEVILSDSLQNEPIAATPPSPHPAAQRPAAPPTGPPAPVGTRETLEYRAALELEMWKEEQEDLFDDQLRRKELRHMQALAEEWKRRYTEREALVKKKEAELSRLEEKLQKTLVDLERREKQLTEAELQTQRLQRELRSEHELTHKELQEERRRLQRESDHRVALEREKVQLMEEERARLLQQIADGESRYKQLEREFLLYREQQNLRPEFRLQSDVNLLRLEKVELERKLESTTKSKLHYKQQWGRALKELARFKQREHENAVVRLKKQQEELEAMRLRYLATEEKEAVRQDLKELDSIRNELNRLKKQEERSGSTPSDPDPAHSSAVNESAEEHLSRLLEERDTLLRTGVYTHEDRIITELNRQIQEAMRDKIP